MGLNSDTVAESETQRKLLLLKDIFDNRLQPTVSIPVVLDLHDSCHSKVANMDINNAVQAVIITDYHTACKHN